MVEKETLIDRISAHPRVWGIITLTAAVCCIVFGALGLMPIKTVFAGNTSESGWAFVKAEGVLVRCDEGSFEIHNTFCRFLPTGVQYIYLAYTEEDNAVFVRADSDWANSFDGGDTVGIYGALRKFNGREQAYIEDIYALQADSFVDLIYVRLDLMLITVGVLLLAETALGALMIKEKIPSQSIGYKFANIVFCTLPVAAAALGIHLVGFV